MNNENNQSSVDFLDVTDATQLVKYPIPIITSLSNTNLDYLKASENVWGLKGNINSYQKGIFLGKGDHSNILFQEFLKKFRKLLEEIIREELRNTNQTSETFKDEFKTLEHVFNIIINHLYANKIEIKDEKFLAVLHGFVNSYIDSVIKQNSI